MASVHSKVAVGVAAVIAVILIISLVQEMNRRWQVQREMQALNQDVKMAERKVIELEQLNQYFRTDDFQERLARENLNYSAPGEAVVLVPEGTEKAQVASSEVAQPVEAISTPMQWWRIFFVEERPFDAFRHEG